MPTEADTEKKTILVVDDDADFLTQLELPLTAAGYEVVTADSQARAEELLEELVPDAAILDLMMENHDGGFVLSYRVKKKNPAIPVILVTAVSSETGLQFGTTDEHERSWVKADVVLPKPVRFEQLERELSRLLGAA